MLETSKKVAKEIELLFGTSTAARELQTIDTTAARELQTFDTIAVRKHESTHLG